MVSAVVLLVVFLILVALNFLFVAVEFALLTLDRNELQRRLDEGDPAAPPPFRTRSCVPPPTCPAPSSASP